MSDQAVIDAAPREARGKGGARALRRGGRMPAIVYGGGGEPLCVSLDHSALERELGRRGFFARLYDLKLGDDTIRVLPRDVQLDPVSDAPLHIDFIRYVAGTTLAVSVEVRFEGQEESEGLKRGGVLNIVRHEVELLCPLESIPEHIVANVAGREIGDSIHISDIDLPEGVTPAIADRGLHHRHHRRAHGLRRAGRGRGRRGRRRGRGRRGGRRRGGRGGSGRRRRGVLERPSSAGPAPPRWAPPPAC